MTDAISRGLPTGKLSDAMIAALRANGIDVEAITVADTTTSFARSMEELCTESTSWPRAASESPVLVVIEKPEEFPEAERGENYRGYFRFTYIDDDGNTSAAQSWMSNKKSGELNPVLMWMREQNAPFAIKLARIETNNPGRYIVRPIPL